MIWIILVVIGLIIFAIIYSKKEVAPPEPPEPVPGPDPHYWKW